MATRMSHCNIPMFDSEKCDIEEYLEVIENVYKAQEVKEEMKVPVLIGSIGFTTYSKLRTYCAPKKPADLSFKEVRDVLLELFSPKPIEIAERYRLHQCKQLEGESVLVFFERLKRSARHCNYGSNLDNTLRDLFVIGIKSTNIQARLLTERSLTLRNAINIATSLETAVEESQLITNKNNASEQINKVKLPPKNSFRNNIVCYCCGEEGHSKLRCRFKFSKCQVCGRRGHLQKVCRDKGSRGLNVVSGSESEGECEVKAMFECVNKVNCKNRPMYLNVGINGKSVQMEIDTGASVSIVSYKQALQIFGGDNLKSNLRPTSVILRTFTGEQLVPKGKIKTWLKYNKQEYTAELYVTNNDGQALLGRDLIRKIPIKWEEVKMLKPNKDGLEDVLRELSQVFEKNLGTVVGTKGKLLLVDNATPVYKKARCLPFTIREKVEEELERLEKANIITKVMHSDWATPIVPVVKPSGNIRICGDYKVTVNPLLKIPDYQLPTIEDIFAKLGGGVIFSKLDLKDAYLQLVMEEESREYLTISTHKGLFRYNRLPFGIAAAPALWQKTMDEVLLGTPAQCYLDDIIISGSSEEEHLQNLRQVLTVLLQKGIRLNKDKCEFMKSKITYCGFMIDRNGLHKTKEKVDAVLRVPRPKDKPTLKSFSGMINYYHKFLSGLSTTLYPLFELLKKNKRWSWDEKCEKAFNEAKRALASEVILCHYDPSLPLVVACDASPVGIGATLSHIIEGKERPVAFASRRLTPCEQKYAQFEREALALVWSVKKFDKYLRGKKFLILTDNKPVRSIFDQKKSITGSASDRIQRWGVTLGAYQYEIRYRKSDQHGNVDGLSRLPLEEPGNEEEDNVEEEIQVLREVDVTGMNLNEIRRETQRDIHLSKVVDLTLNGWPEHLGAMELEAYHSRRTEITLEDGILLWGRRVIIPTSMQWKILKELHDGHLGERKMKEIARSYVWWPGLNHAIEQTAKNCDGCNLNQRNPDKIENHPWRWPERPWQRIHVDFAGPYMGANFMVVMDAHSKWPEVFIMRSTSSEATVQVLRTLFTRLGIPEQLVSDNGPQFISENFSRFLKENDVIHKRSAPYHPATNGQVERFIQTMKKSLKAMKEDIPLQTKLDKFLMAYRIAPHSTTGQPPSLLLMGRVIRTRLDSLRPNLRDKVERKQNETHSKTRTVSEYEMGDKVLARDYRGPSRWKRGIIAEVVGTRHFIVQVGNERWRRHAEQLRKDCGVQMNENKCNEKVTAKTIDSTWVLPHGSREVERTANDVSTNQEARRVEQTIEEPRPDSTRRSGRMRAPPRRLTYIEPGTISGGEKDVRE